MEDCHKSISTQKDFTYLIYSKRKHKRDIEDPHSKIPSNEECFSMYMNPLASKIHPISVTYEDAMSTY